MPTLRQLSYLVAIAEEGHFGRASQRTHATQPTLSSQLRTLEATLGVQLVERGRHGATITPVGREVVDRARRVLAEVDAIRGVAAKGAGGLAGIVRLGVPATLGPYLLRYIVPELHRRYPDLKLFVREDFPRALADRLEAGAFDLVLSPLSQERRHIAFAPLFDEPLLLVCAPDHALAGAGPLDRRALEGAKVLTLEPGYFLHEQVRQVCDAYGAEILQDYEGTSLDTLRLMAGMGVGLAFLPALYVRSEIAAGGDLCVRPLASEPPVRTIGLGWRHTSGNAADYAAMAEMIRSIAAQALPEVSVRTQ
ncbi:DNA-binding transcriptional regulator OxyR [Rhodothalassium salexigens]|uniref:hydrogen peroxide-inducible genes activator n=1 Tax=Rhodothalassium salexigens TaxID=1086 RepID=UPI001911C27D|nr:hydrogen peroxide-inducible genes activator [Rhodothalassium salexigens]MBK5910185.1 DNA-binding transcriptional regulator OxyR [Rhodothalassium salexigens]MBK5920827.1 DNA-binding transcriptional regulator OxyR [Rhodothalassium salexigens]